MITFITIMIDFIPVLISSPRPLSDCGRLVFDDDGVRRVHVSQQKRRLAPLPALFLPRRRHRRHRHSRLARH